MELGYDVTFLPDNLDYRERYTDDLFNTVDLHFLREERSAELENSDRLRQEAKKTKAREFALMRAVDAAIVLSSAELALLRQCDPSLRVSLLPFFRPLPGRTLPFSRRRDIVFIGGF